MQEEKVLRLKVTFICSERIYDNDECVGCTPLGKRIEYFKHWDEIKQYILNKYISDIECSIFDVEPCEIPF